MREVTGGEVTNDFCFSISHFADNQLLRSICCIVAIPINVRIACAVSWNDSYCGPIRLDNTPTGPDNVTKFYAEGILVRRQVFSRDERKKE